MKKTLKRELKLFEVVESEAIVVSVCKLPLVSFFFRMHARTHIARACVCVNLIKSN